MKSAWNIFVNINNFAIFFLMLSRWSHVECYLNQCILCIYAYLSISTAAQLCVCSALCGLQPCRQRLVHRKRRKTQNTLQISCGSGEKWPPLVGDFKYAKVLELRRHTEAREAWYYRAKSLCTHHSLYNGGIAQCLIRIVAVCVRRVRSS